MDNYDEKLWTHHQTDNVKNFLVGHPRQDMLFKKISNLIKPGKILEIGFGDGYLLKKLSKKYECFGADISSINIKQAKKNTSSVRFKVIETDGVLPYDSDCFDAFIASEVMEHMSNQELVVCISEIYRILKKDGYVFITVPAEENLQENECFCPSCSHRFHKWGHKQIWGKEKILQKFKEFDIIYLKRKFFSNPGLNFFGKIGVIAKIILSKFRSVSGATFLIILKKR